eukprot:GHVO01069226.1.p1 GENE.GHVO01069226.1~~GHVO01069226.1.p1  ORF type:complete len:215 (-),score=23.43 GHVO01069226.1:40-663(-)
MEKSHQRMIHHYQSVVEQIEKAESLLARDDVEADEFRRVLRPMVSHLQSRSRSRNSRRISHPRRPVPILSDRRRPVPILSDRHSTRFGESAPNASCDEGADDAFYDADEESADLPKRGEESFLPPHEEPPIFTGETSLEDSQMVTPLQSQESTDVKRRTKLPQPRKDMKVSLWAFLRNSIVVACTCAIIHTYDKSVYRVVYDSCMGG